MPDLRNLRPEYLGIGTQCHWIPFVAGICRRLWPFVCWGKRFGRTTRRKTCLDRVSGGRTWSMAKFLGDFSWKVEGRRTAILTEGKIYCINFRPVNLKPQNLTGRIPSKSGLVSLFFSRNSILWCNMCFHQSAFWQTLIAWVGWFITWSHKNIPEIPWTKIPGCRFSCFRTLQRFTVFRALWVQKRRWDRTFGSRTERSSFHERIIGLNRVGRYLTNPNNALFFSGIFPPKLGPILSTPCWHGEFCCWVKCWRCCKLQECLDYEVLFAIHTSNP